MPQIGFSIGEPEGSQDTPLRNTTPLRKRLRDQDVPPAPVRQSKKQKMNQCQLSFHIILMTILMDEKFDPNFRPIDEDLMAMHKKLDDSKAHTQTLKQDDDDLWQIVQDLEEKSQAARRSKDSFLAKATQSAVVSGSQQTKPTSIDMLDRDDHHDDLIIHGCTTALNARADAFRVALETTDQVKQQIEDFRSELGQAREEYLKKLEELQLEYKLILSQQRRELSDEVRRNKEREQRSNLLILDRAHTKSTWQEELTTRLSAEWSSKVAVANAATAELSLKLAGAEKAKNESDSQLAAIKGQLISLAQEQDELKKYALNASDVSKDLCDRLAEERADHAAEIQRLNNKVLESSRELQHVRKSLVNVEACATRTKQRLDTSMSDYATLLITVALTQKQKLGIARRQKGQLDSYLTQARSTIMSLESRLDKLEEKLKVKANQLEAKDRKLAQSGDLLGLTTKSLEYMKEKVGTVNNTLTEKNKKILAHQVSIKHLNETNAQLGTELQVKDNLLTSKDAQLSDNKAEIQKLIAQASSNTEKLRLQRSTISQKDKQLHECQTTNKTKEATIKQLKSGLISNERALQDNASTIRSHEGRIRDLENERQSLEGEKARTGASMTELALKLNTVKDQLNTQVRLLEESNARIHDLEATNARLCEAKGKITDEMIVLKSRLLTLDLDLEDKNAELRSQRSATAWNSERITSLEAEIHQAREEAKNEKSSLDVSLRKANTRVETLESELNVRAQGLTLADKVKQQLQQRLEQVSRDLSTEKSANRTATLEKSLAIADERIETLSTDLRTTTMRLEDERADSASLFNAMKNGRVVRGVLEGRPVSIQAFISHKDHKALFVIEKGPDAIILWKGSLDRCTFETVNWVWCLRLDQGSDEGHGGAIDVGIDADNVGDLMELFSGSNSGIIPSS